MKQSVNLSIIITVYNLEKYISECIESIINQKINFKDIEIIIIDDGSIDNSRKICENYAAHDEYIKYFYQKNKGVSSARNNGINKSYGKYLLMIDGDDILLPGSLKKIIDILPKGYDIIQSQFIKFKKSKDINIPRQKETNLEVELINNSDYPDNIKHLFDSRLYNLSLAVNVIKKTLIGKKRINEKLKYTEDMDFVLTCLLEAKKVYFLQSPIYGYRQGRRSSATRSISKKRIDDVMYFIAKWEKYCEETKSIFSNDIIGFVAYQLLIVVGLVYSIKDSSLKEEIRKKMYLLKKSNSVKIKMVQILYKTLGFRITSFLLNVYLRLK